MRDNLNAPPVNPLPWIVWAIALPIIALEVVVSLGARGVVGGPTAIGWRLDAMERMAFSPEEKVAIARQIGLAQDLEEFRTLQPPQPPTLPLPLALPTLDLLPRLSGFLGPMEEAAVAAAAAAAGGGAGTWAAVGTAALAVLMAEMSLFMVCLFLLHVREHFSRLKDLI